MNKVFKTLITSVILLLTFNFQILALKEYIDSDVITANVATETTFTVGAKAIYYLNPGGNNLHVKWPNANEFELFIGANIIDPETTFEYGNEIVVQAAAVTHNVYIGIYRER